MEVDHSVSRPGIELPPLTSSQLSAFIRRNDKHHVIKPNRDIGYTPIVSTKIPIAQVRSNRDNHVEQCHVTPQRMYTNTDSVTQTSPTATLTHPITPSIISLPTNNPKQEMSNYSDVPICIDIPSPNIHTKKDITVNKSCVSNFVELSITPNVHSKSDATNESNQNIDSSVTQTAEMTSHDSQSQNLSNEAQSKNIHAEPKTTTTDDSNVSYFAKLPTGRLFIKQIQEDGKSQTKTTVFVRVVSEVYYWCGGVDTRETQESGGDVHVSCDFVKIEEAVTDSTPPTTDATTATRTVIPTISTIQPHKLTKKHHISRKTSKKTSSTRQNPQKSQKRNTTVKTTVKTRPTRIVTNTRNSRTKACNKQTKTEMKVTIINTDSAYKTSQNCKSLLFPTQQEVEITESKNSDHDIQNCESDNSDWPQENDDTDIDESLASQPSNSASNIEFDDFGRQLRDSGRMKQCPICGYVFGHMTDVGNHYKSTHPGEKPFSCVLCQKGYYDYKRMRRHFRLHTGEGVHICKVCGKRFTTAHELLKHQRVYTNRDCRKISCRLCDARVTTFIGLRRHFDEKHHGEKPHKCEHCDKAYMDRKELLKHALIHSSSELFNCSLCPRGFIRKRYLVSHVAAKHGGAKSHQCDVCLKYFAIPSAVASHKRNIHATNKKFICETCGASFTSGSRLENHRIVHSTAKPFSCEFCLKTFARKVSLDMHLLLHTGNKRFCCETCGKTFVHYSKLQNHIPVHTGKKKHICTVCNQGYMTANSLRNHAVTHTHVRAYICHICKHDFVQASGLRKHLARTHGLGKVFTCNVCQMGFGTTKDLKSHIQSCHVVL